jgi:hypothetical protein
MSAIVKTLIAAEIAKLTRETDAPSAPFGYGRDLSCVDDVTEALDEVDPFSYQGIAEAVIRRLTCPRGGLPDDPDYGIDLRSHLNRGTTQRELQLLVLSIAGELRKDDRIDSATATVSIAGGGSRIDVAIIIAPADPDLATFTLTFAVTDGAAALQALTLAG